MSVSILEIQLHDRSLLEAAEEMIQDCLTLKHGANRLISATGAHGLVHAKYNAGFRTTLQGFYRNLPDGVPAVWIGRLKGAKAMERCYGPTFFEIIMRISADRNIQHYFCGGKDGVAENLRKVCNERFGNRNCSGVYSPPFREMTEEELKNLARDIAGRKTDILWIGMSTPKQEMFAAQLSQFVKVKFIVTVGAAFDFHTGNIRQAPAWMQQVGLEWLFRLLMEPRRLFRRYFKIVPLFLYYGTIDLINFWWNKQETS